MALCHATSAQFEHCYGVYIVSHGQWDKHHMGSVKRDFLLSHVQQLQVQLHAIGIPLLVLDVGLYADIPEQLYKLCQRLSVTELFGNYEYPLNELNRDKAVVERLQQIEVECNFSHDYVVHPPGSIRTLNKDYYKVFTPFQKNWLRKTSDQSLQEYSAMAKNWPASISFQDIKYQYSPVKPVVLELWPVLDTQQKLQHFVDERARDYKQHRDTPSIEGTSSLSAYLAIGAISIRACLRYARFANEGRLSGGNEGIDTWISELVWREFYQHILVGFPRVVKSQPFQAYTQWVNWSRSEVNLEAWKQGHTGIPIVDAAMRQLNQTGWMHNRLRMVVAMFLTKNLFIDWREGEKYFAQCLVDWEFGANNGGWQWAASTGTDAAPYFRIFNPVSQSQRFDPQGEFIRRYVPELAHLDYKQIHEPHKMKGGGLFDAVLHYPPPIVDLKNSRKQAIEAFKIAKQTYDSHH
jgi:deoxyribodipyrimidine photo-lyase